MPYIFVYGTLRKELHNNWLLYHDNFIGQYTTTESFYMVSQKSKSFPFISAEHILGESFPCKVVGEIYDVSPLVLSRIDSLKGYTRRPIHIDAFAEPVEAYILTSKSVRDDIRQSGRYVAINNGDFVEFVKNHYIQ
jgi:gamma-glutamylcyclotransferase (GGCT)/AIG2-like uncharacterized protein YtfP